MKTNVLVMQLGMNKLHLPSSTQMLDLCLPEISEEHKTKKIKFLVDRKNPLVRFIEEYCFLKTGKTADLDMSYIVVSSNNWGAKNLQDNEVKEIIIFHTDKVFSEEEKSLIASFFEAGIKPKVLTF